MLSSKANPSFTLIEIIVVIGIVSLLSGFGLVNYNKFTEEKKLETEAKNFADILESARKKALSGDVTSCIPITVTPRVKSYSVEINSNDLQYQLSSKCLTGTPALTPPIHYLKTNIIFPTPHPTIEFYSLSVPTPIVAQCIKIKNTTLNKCHYIGIGSSGLINEGTCGTTPCSTCTCP